MTREEKKKAIDALKISAPVMAVTQEEFNDYIQTLNKVMNWLEQEPSGDLISRVEAIKAIDKKAKRIKNADTLNGLAGAVGILFDLPSVNQQEPCEDAISRQAVDVLVDELARAISDERCCISRGRSTATIMQNILDLPPVKPQEPKKEKYDNRWFNGYAN